MSNTREPLFSDAEIEAFRAWLAKEKKRYEGKYLVTTGDPAPRS